MPTDQPLLVVESIDTFYGDAQALNGLSLTVKPGETVCLLGRNGQGKTTTIKSILGLVPPRRGRIAFDGADITHLPTHRIASRGIAWVPDNRRIFPTLTVERNLEMGLHRALPPGETRRGGRWIGFTRAFRSSADCGTGAVST